jgi:hypothetical protein
MLPTDRAQCWRQQGGFGVAVFSQGTIGRGASDKSAAVL